MNKTTTRPRKSDKHSGCHFSDGMENENNKKYRIRNKEQRSQTMRATRRGGDGATGRPERATQPSPAATPWGINERNPSAEKRQTKQLPCFGRLPALQGKEM
jgi:hypothetical protein